MSERTPNPGSTAVEADHVTPYLGFLFVLLSTATLFDGFDSGMLSFAAPDVRKSLDISLVEWGFINSLARLGVMASFFFLLYADRFGRRATMMVTVVGFTVFNGLTAFATDKVEFTLCQFAARLFLTAEYSLAVIMVGEEFPARLRGRAVAVLTSLATVGVMVMAKGIQPFVLLPEGADTNGLHQLGSSVVAGVQGLMGLEADDANWRALYVLGAFPLILVLVLRLGMRETRRFTATRAERADSGRERPTFAEILRNARLPWTRMYRRRTLIVTLLWNSVYIVVGPSVVFWVIFAREELGLTPTQVGDIVFWGYAGGTAGHFVAAWLIERAGRRWTCAGFYFCASVSIFFLYQIPSLTGQYIWMFATVFSFGAANTSTHVYASELFPTEIRATGYGWTTNLFGRITEVLTPMVIGLLIAPLGISWAIAVVAVGPILGGVLVLRYAPETRGLTLEEIQVKLAEPAQAT